MKLQRLLDEGLFTASYEFALLCSLADLSIEAGDDSGAPLQLATDRLAKLEKQNQELLSQLKQQQAATDLNLQAKCAKDAREFVSRGWSESKNTIMLDYTNHYNKSLNACMIMVDYRNYMDGAIRTGSWYLNLVLYDLYENNRRAIVSQLTNIQRWPDYKSTTRVTNCEVDGNKCSSIDDFNTKTRSYMSN